MRISANESRMTGIRLRFRWYSPPPFLAVPPARNYRVTNERRAFTSTHACTHIFAYTIRGKANVYYEDEREEGEIERERKIFFGIASVLFAHRMPLDSVAISGSAAHRKILYIANTPCKFPILYIFLSMRSVLIFASLIVFCYVL